MAVSEDDGAVDVAVVVADAYHGLGVGRRMVHEPAERLTASGVTEICAHVQVHNSVVTNWMRRSLTDLRTERSRDTLAVRGGFLPLSLPRAAGR
jgi:GNAT superfamily N-acetyltransferase